MSYLTLGKSSDSVYLFDYDLTLCIYTNESCLSFFWSGNRSSNTDISGEVKPVLINHCSSFCWVFSFFFAGLFYCRKRFKFILRKLQLFLNILFYFITIQKWGKIDLQDLNIAINHHHHRSYSTAGYMLPHRL